MAMKVKEAIENIDEIVMRLREIRRDAEDNGGAAYDLGKFAIRATTRAITDMLEISENLLLQIEAEPETLPKSEGMTVRELIAKLQKVKNQDAIARVSQAGTGNLPIQEVTDDYAISFLRTMKIGCPSTIN